MKTQQFQASRPYESSTISFDKYCSNHVMYEKDKKNKQKEWQQATKSLIS
jgi:hypothetical protein